MGVHSFCHDGRETVLNVCLSRLKDYKFACFCIRIEAFQLVFVCLSILHYHNICSQITLHSGTRYYKRGLQRCSRNVTSYLPRYNNYEVHDIPWISEVASFVQYKPVGEDFHAHFNSKNYHEHRFQLFLKYKQNIKCVLRQTLKHTLS